jgi:hypothetical protein
MRVRAGDELRKLASKPGLLFLDAQMPGYGALTCLSCWAAFDEALPTVRVFCARTCISAQVWHAPGQFMASTDNVPAHVVQARPTPPG